MTIDRNRKIAILAIAGILSGTLFTAGALFLFSRSSRTVSSEGIKALTEELREQDRQSSFHPSTSASSASETFQSSLAPDQEEDFDVLSTRTDLERENRELRSLNQKLSVQLTEVFNWILSNFKGKRPLDERHLSKLALTPVTDAFTLHPEVAEFLHVTPDEEVMINDALDYASAIIRELEEDALTLTKPRAEKVILHIPSFEEEGEVLREELYGALEATLGVDRFDTFLDVSSDGLDTSFHQFGTASRTIIFELKSGVNDEPPQIIVKDGWITETDEHSRTIQVTESTLDSFPEEYAEYLQHLPEELRLPVAIETP